jgi:hypothetical protein
MVGVTLFAEWPMVDRQSGCWEWQPRAEDRE